ncbi:MAG: hypothetical protein FWF54_01785 [Candidatus Azobacteroides sp.]|nr:hypothetical protein [Candidatus Azobacteroides sp.]
MKKSVFLFMVAAITTLIESGFINAQEKSGQLQISGSPVISVFADYHAGFGSNNSLSGFEITRAYLGYQFNLTPTVSGKAIVDAGVAPAESFMASQEKKIYLKNAFLSWKDKGFTINGGLIGLMQFSLQEKFWSYRYVAQSFQDLYKMGSSADLGVTVEYQFLKWLSADFGFTNGEGYKNLNMDNKYRYDLGITAKPIPELTLRAYGDIFQRSLGDKDQRTLALFAGYKCKSFSLGAEYNYQQNNLWIKDNNYYGFSVYTTIPINDKWKVFGRYDYVDSKDQNDNTWSTLTGDMIIAGIEYCPIKNLKFAPNYKRVKDTNVGSSSYNKYNWAYLNVEFTW